MREKTTRRWLSLLLTVVMVLSLVPATALAAYFGAPVGDLSPIDSLEPIEKLEPVEGEEPIDVLPVEEEPVTDSDLAGEEALETAALTIGSKPADGRTTGEPFASGTGGSTYFRIPALVTLSDGTLVAAADARWNQTGDGWGLDTIVSRSSNYGATWSYTFANYLGDNGNVYNSDSTAFIDPALAVASDDTIYMLVDLYPHGTYIGNVKAGTGYDEKGRLLLTKDGTNYDYYVGEFIDGEAQIWKTDATMDEGYTVDEYFNITGNGVKTNLFFSDSPYQVLGTSYLYLTKSIDGGETWSAPMMLNSQVKDTNDKFYGVGPGGGIVTSTGRIIFPCYTYTTQDGNTSVIYSDDGGQTWTRSADMNVQTSEASISEVTVNDQNYLYMFTRHGGYFVSEDDGTTWSNRQSVSGISYTTSCELSTLTYSETIDGRPAILLSAPTSGRTTGKIFVGLVQDNGSISWDYTYSVNGSGNYAYSDLAELSDGSIGLLYENASGSITYDNIAITDIAPNAEIGDSDPNENICCDDATGVSVNFGANNVTEMTVALVTNVDALAGRKYVAYDITPVDYTDSAEVTIPLTDELSACANLTGFVVNTDGTVTEIEGKRVGDSYTFTTPHFSVVGVVEPQASEDVTQTKNVTVYVGQSTTITDTTGNHGTATVLDDGIARVTTEGKDGTEGSQTLTPVTSVSSGSSYYIQSSDGRYLNSSANWVDSIENAAQWTWDGNYLKNGSNYLRYRSSSWSTSSSNKTQLYFNDGTFYCTRNSSWNNGWVYTYSNPLGSPMTFTSTAATPASTTITITGVAEGTTSVVVGSTQYNITVKEKPDGVDLASTPFTSGTGQYSGQKVTKLTTSVNMSYDLNLNVSGSSIVWSSADESVATVNQNGTITGVGAGETTVTCTVDGVPYTIPVVVVSDSYGGSYGYTCDIRISEITNTTVRYSLNLSTSFLDAQEGEAIYLGYNYPFCINFFGVEDNGYALTYMASTNSAGNYYSLYPVSALSELAAYNGGAIKNQLESTLFDSSAVNTMLWKAINEGYHGTMGWTRAGSNGSIYSDLTFRSQKLPTVEKSIKTVNGVAYTEGMTAKKGDVIVYDVTVTQYATTEAITYSNTSLTDNLDGATFSTNGSTTVSPSLSNSTLTANRTNSYTVTYTITEEDLDTDIVNTVNLNYSYKGPYSEGTYGGTAKAEAKISAPTFTPQDIVIDFGLPVTINYSAADAHGKYNLAGGHANNGTVEVTDNVVTYTPNEAFLLYGSGGVDTVTLTNTAGTEYRFKVIPASNVLYEDNFLTVNTEKGTTGAVWTAPTTTITDKQSSDQTTLYGHDTAYDASTGNSMDSAWTISGLTSGNGSQYLTTSFYGTGFDLIGTAGPNTGYVYLVLQGPENKLVVVDTSYVGGGTLSQVPLAHLENLKEGTYTVNIRAAYRAEKAADSGNSISLYSANRASSAASDVYAMVEELYMDGFEIDDVEFVYFDESSALAKLDNAAAATYSLNSASAAETNAAGRPAGTTVTIDGFRVYRSSNNDSYIESERNVTYVNVLDAVQSSNACFTESDSEYTWTNRADYESNGGPQNEIYLAAGQSVVLSTGLTKGTTVQVSARAVTGDKVMLNSTEIASNTEMYYTVEVGDAGTITIGNTGSGLLALGNLKVKAGTTYSEVTDETLAIATLMLRTYAAAAPVEPDEPEEPEVPVFQPAKLDLNVTSANFFTRKIVTLSITASSDVAYLTVNGKRVEPTNALLVKWGLAKNYLYVVTDTVSRNATAEFAVVAYDANGVASEVYVKQG